MENAQKGENWNYNNTCNQNWHNHPTSHGMDMGTKFYQNQYKNQRQSQCMQLIAQPSTLKDIIKKIMTDQANMISDMKN